MLNRFKQINSSNQVCQTLPITCQICLGKVKEPCVCPNLHAFCATCIEIWLEKSKQCPTCRTPITKENPCRRILGGVENLDDVDLLKPTDFSHSMTRKARYLNLYQQYEDEINRLLKYIDSLNSEIDKYKENSNNLGANANNGGGNGTSGSPKYEMLTLVKNKLQQTQATLDELIKERDKLKEQNKKLESENSILMQEIMRLKQNLNEKASQTPSKYTIAALETKLESYEKEIKQLQKALEKSDKYIADLEQKHRDKDSKINHQFKDNSLITNLQSSSSSTLVNSSSQQFGVNQTPNNENQTNFGLITPPSSSTIINNLNSLSGNKIGSSGPPSNLKLTNQTSKSDLKVKFSEKVEKIPNTTTSTSSNNNSANSSIISPSLSSNSSSVSFNPSLNQTAHQSNQLFSSTSNFFTSGGNKQAIISNDKFYGSPNKAGHFSTTSSMLSSTAPVILPSSILSFTERLKKSSNNSNNNNNNNLSFELEAPSPLSQSLSAVNQSSASLLNNNFEAQHSNSGNSHQFLFSPMKRLRLDEYLEKPSFNADESLANITTTNTTFNLNQIEMSQKLMSPPSNNKSNNNSQFVAVDSNHENNNEHSPIRILDLDTKKTIVKPLSHHNHPSTPYNHNYDCNNGTTRFKNNNNNSNNESQRMIDDSNEEIKSELSNYLNSSTTEFNDCLKLLSQAEKKVQKRLSPESKKQSLNNPIFTTASSFSNLKSDNLSGEDYSSKLSSNEQANGYLALSYKNVNQNPINSTCLSSDSSINSNSATISTGSNLFSLSSQNSLNLNQNPSTSIINGLKSNLGSYSVNFNSNLNKSPPQNSSFVSNNSNNNNNSSNLLSPIRKFPSFEQNLNGQFQFANQNKQKSPKDLSSNHFSPQHISNQNTSGESAKVSPTQSATNRSRSVEPIFRIVKT